MVPLVVAAPWSTVAPDACQLGDERTRARRIQVPDDVRAIDDPPSPDYASAFELAIPVPSTRAPEQWARSLFEDAPLLVRSFVRTGWRFPLLFFRAAPGRPNVLGARIVRKEPTVLVLEQHSPMMIAHNVVYLEPSRIVWTTLVHYRRAIARPLWSTSAVIHHRLLPYLLTRAGRRDCPAQQ